MRPPPRPQLLVYPPPPPNPNAGLPHGVAHGAPAGGPLHGAPVGGPLLHGMPPYIPPGAAPHNPPAGGGGGGHHIPMGVPVGDEPERHHHTMILNLIRKHGPAHRRRKPAPVHHRPHNRHAGYIVHKNGAYIVMSPDGKQRLGVFGNESAARKRLAHLDAVAKRFHKLHSVKR